MRQRMEQMRLSALDLASEAGVSYNAVNEFLTGRRVWPQPRTREAVEAALSWSTGTLTRIAADADRVELADTPRSEGADSEGAITTRSLVVHWPQDAFEGLTDAERAEAEAAALAAGLERLREIRQARAERAAADGGRRGASGATDS